MIAKCNITELALKKVGGIYYSLACSKDNDSAIIENYVEYLNCPNVNLEVCNAIPCFNPAIIFNCGFKINKLLLSITGNVLTFSVDTTTYTGGTTPFSFEWNFDTSVFDISSPINQNVLVLTLKAGKVLADLVTPVSITMIDSNNCSNTKQCWFNQGSLTCNQNFVACVNPQDLEIGTTVTNCVSPTNLIVV